MATQYDPLSPDWWVRRLHKQLSVRQEELKCLQDYHCGDHPLPNLQEKARREFKRLLGMSRANRLDADSRLVFSESIKRCTAYMLVEPNEAVLSTPITTPEHPSQAIIEYTPGSRRLKAAGLKSWLDDWTGKGEPVVHWTALVLLLIGFHFDLLAS